MLLKTTVIGTDHPKQYLQLATSQYGAEFSTPQPRILIATKETKVTFESNEDRLRTMATKA